MSSIIRQPGPVAVQTSHPANTNGGDIVKCGDLPKEAKHGDTATNKRILDKEPKKVDGKCTPRNITAVIAAAISGQQKAVEALCDYSASVEIRDVDSYTIIKLSIDAGHKDIAEYLANRYPKMVITDSRLPKGAKWLTEQFK